MFQMHIGKIQKKCIWIKGQGIGVDYKTVFTRSLNSIVWTLLQAEKNALGFFQQKDKFKTQMSIPVFLYIQSVMRKN